MMYKILLVGLGGGLGSIARFLCQRWIFSMFPHAFPLGTFFVNMLGCFLIGIFWALSARSMQDSDIWKLLLMTGFCGGYTTFSAFTFEGVDLLRQQKTGIFFFYIGTSVVIGLLATWAGFKFIRG